MALILETDSGTGANLSAELAIGEYTAIRDTWLRAYVKLSSLNGAAATFTCVLRGKSSIGTNEGEVYFAQAKRTAADTVFSFPIGPILLNSGEKVEIRLLSSNASDTAAAWSVDWIDEQQIGPAQVFDNAGQTTAMPANVEFIFGQSTDQSALGLNAMGLAYTNGGGRMPSQVKGIDANAITAASIATDAITAAKIAPDAIGASELAADAVTKIAAGVASSGGLRGSGASSVTCTFTNTTTGLAVPDADVWITSDAAGTAVVAGTLQTNSSGQAVFLLDAGTTYYFWGQKDGVNSVRGTSFVAAAD